MYALHSVATALAMSVLPVPGGPYSRMPERCLMPVSHAKHACVPKGDEMSDTQLPREQTARAELIRTGCK